MSLIGTHAGPLLPFPPSVSYAPHDLFIPHRYRVPVVGGATVRPRSSHVLVWSIGCLFPWLSPHRGAIDSSATLFPRRWLRTVRSMTPGHGSRGQPAGGCVGIGFSGVLSHYHSQLETARPAAGGTAAATVAAAAERRQAPTETMSADRPTKRMNESSQATRCCWFWSLALMALMAL